VFLFIGLLAAIEAAVGSELGVGQVVRVLSGCHWC